jgi:glycerol-3-phosphate O-acyltransferase
VATTTATRTKILLLDVTTAVERDAIQQWIETNEDGPVETLLLDDAKLAARLREDDDPLLSPVGVSWLPPEHRGRRRARVRHLVSLRDPWHPRPASQRKILRDEPDRCEIVIAEPARESALRRRFDANPGGAFDDFVRRQAHLALERAERALVGVQYKVPKLVFEEITDSDRFNEGAAALAEELGLESKEVLDRAREGLGEMVASQSRTAIDLWDPFGRFLARAHRISVDDSRIDELRDLGRRHSLIFLPSHRSYLDPLVLRPALLRHGLPPNHVLGGLNVSFWPIGPITRRSSYVFIRRQFRGDDVYRWTLQQYMTYLIRKRFNVEWYIEGGRSRTGKLRPPRYGILSYLVDGFRAEQLDDAFIVPTSITY